MVSPGDNMAQTEPEDEPEDGFVTYSQEECKNCDGHQRQDHYDRAGCTVNTVINLHSAASHYERCHCTNFEAVKE